MAQYSLAKILELGFPGANTEEAVIKSVLATYDKTVRADMKYVAA